MFVDDCEETILEGLELLLAAGVEHVVHVEVHVLNLVLTVYRHILSILNRSYQFIFQQTLRKTCKLSDRLI